MVKNFSMIDKRKILDNQPPTLLFYRLIKQSSKTAEVAQLVEQRPEKPRVRSSILRLGTILSQQALNPKLETLNKFKIQISKSFEFPAFEII